MYEPSKVRRKLDLLYPVGINKRASLLLPFGKAALLVGCRLVEIIFSMIWSALSYKSCNVLARSGRIIEAEDCNRWGWKRRNFAHKIFWPAWNLLQFLRVRRQFRWRNMVPMFWHLVDWFEFASWSWSGRDRNPIIMCDHGWGKTGLPKAILEVLMAPTLSAFQTPSDGPNVSRYNEVPLRPALLLLLLCKNPCSSHISTWWCAIM